MIVPLVGANVVLPNVMLDSSVQVAAIAAIDDRDRAAGLVLLPGLIVVARVQSGIERTAGPGVVQGDVNVAVEVQIGRRDAAPESLAAAIINVVVDGVLPRLPSVRELPPKNVLGFEFTSVSSPTLSAPAAITIEPEPV